MTKNLFEKFFLGAGRIPRATLIWRLVILALLCAAFGALALNLGGDWWADLFAAIFVWSSCALCVQRLHDVGRTGYAMLYFIIPVLGPLWLLTQLLKRSVEGTNRFGDNPTSRSGYLTVNISL